IDVTRIVAHEKCGEVRDFVDGAKAVQRAAIERQLFELWARQHARERALRGDRPGSNSVHANTAVRPLDGEAASERINPGFGDGRGNDISRADRRVSCGDAEHGSAAFLAEPTASAGESGMQRAFKYDVDHRLPGPWREFFTAGNE